MKKQFTAFWTGLVFLLVLTAAQPARAQQKGQYLPGTSGLNSGLQAPPGFTYANVFTYYSSSTIKDPNGETIPSLGGLDMIVDQNLFVYTTKWKLLGAAVGVLLDVPVANASITAPILDIEGGGAGLSDIYIEPLNLGWHLPQADIRAAYGFVAPTGRYSPGATDNIGSGYWGHFLSLAGTFYPDKTRFWSISANGVYEFHQQKESSDITPGQTFTLEYGAGRLWPMGKQLIQVGVVGYGQWQTSDNGGQDAANSFNGYRVAAIGPQLSLIIPQKKVSLAVRYEPEFAARSRVQGNTLVITGGITF